MLSSVSRLLMRVVAVSFALLGLVLFLAPEWAAPNFLWGISPFVAMTMGGWYLGSAIMAWLAAWTWRWSSVRAAVVFVWSFALLEAGVLILHASAVRLTAMLAVPYLLTIGLAAMTALIGIGEWLRRRPSDEPEGPPVPLLARIAIAAYVLFQPFLAVVALMGPRSAINGTIFPEAITPFTLRAFGAFYLALGIAALPLLWARGSAPIIIYALGGFGLVLPILFASFWHFGAFDFSARPGGMFYLGAYLIVLVGALLYWWLDRRWRLGQPPRATAPILH
jgi:hypothetical protein